MPDATQHLDEALCSELLDMTAMIGDLDTPDQVLEHLHKITSRKLDINVLGAVQLPREFGDFDAVVDRKTIFLHQSVPREWWKEYARTSRDHPSLIYAMAQLSLAPFTVTETMQKLDPVGADRWSVDLSLKHGMRDSLACPVGGRWVFPYWSADVMTKRLTPQLRAMLFMAANFAVIRLQELVGNKAKRLNQSVALTPRETAVLFSLSRGKRAAETAVELEIGEETVRTHLKKAQAKLEARTQSFAVAKAIRQRLIP